MFHLLPLPSYGSPRKSAFSGSQVMPISAEPVDELFFHQACFCWNIFSASIIFTSNSNISGPSGRGLFIGQVCQKKFQYQSPLQVLTIPAEEPLLLVARLYCIFFWHCRLYTIIKETMCTEIVKCCVILDLSVTTLSFLFPKSGVCFILKWHQCCLSTEQWFLTSTR